MISFDEFKRLDIRIARVKSVEAHPNADKLYVMKIDLGGEERTIVAGLRGHYEASELEGRLIAVVANLEPATLRGVKSEGMLLAAQEGDKVVLLTPEREVSPGAKVL